ncbi:MAG: DUF3108 domain-containing protein [Spirochaetales bacterium]|nr:DUF3108 domain-containing protein [Spirochaetales bacterium]
MIRRSIWPLLFPTILCAEVLVYDLTWKGIRAGEARLEKTRHLCGKTPCLKYRSIARSLPSFAAIYTVKDEVISHFDPVRKRTLFSQKLLREGRYLREYSARFDYSTSRILYEESRGSGAVKKGESRPLPDPMLDILSAFYIARDLPLSLKSGQRFELHVFDDLKIIAMEIRVLKESQLQLDLGAGMERFPAFLIQPIFASSGFFRSKGPPLIWISQAPGRIPLLLQAEVPLAGRVQARLRQRGP